MTIKELLIQQGYGILVDDLGFLCLAQNGSSVFRPDAPESAREDESDVWDDAVKLILSRANTGDRYFSFDGAEGIVRVGKNEIAIYSNNPLSFRRIEDDPDLDTCKCVLYVNKEF